MTDTRKRLALICGMFGSAHVGERAAAAAKAHEIVKGAEAPDFSKRRLTLSAIPELTPAEAKQHRPERVRAWRRRPVKMGDAL